MRENRMMLFGKPIVFNELWLEKKLFKSDINGNCRLAIANKVVDELILKHCTDDQKKQVNDKKGMSITFFDLDEKKEMEFVFKRWLSSKTYVILKGWSKFIRRRALKTNDIIQISRDNVNGKFLIKCIKNTNIMHAEKKAKMNIISLHTSS